MNRTAVGLTRQSILFEKMLCPLSRTIHARIKPAHDEWRYAFLASNAIRTARPASTVPIR
jgi:hypothetical protein